MKVLTIIVLIFTVGQVFGQADNNVRQIPADLNKLGVTSFYEPKEILRIWRFPEGGAAFEEMIDDTKRKVRTEGEKVLGPLTKGPV